MTDEEYKKKILDLIYADNGPCVIPISKALERERDDHIGQIDQLAAQLDEALREIESHRINEKATLDRLDEARKRIEYEKYMGVNGMKVLAENLEKTKADLDAAR